MRLRKRAYILTSILLFLATIGASAACRPQLPPISASPAYSPASFPTSIVQASDTAAPPATDTAMPISSATPGVTIEIDGPLSPISYVTPLMCLHVTEDTAIVYFELESISEGYLFYWPVSASPGESKMVPFSSDSAEQLMTVTGLTPGLEYYFAVGIQAGNRDALMPKFLDGLWDPIRVRTKKENDWPLRVGAIGDSGFGEPVTMQLAELMASYDLDFVLHMGDIVYHVDENNGPEEAFALKYFRPFAPLLRLTTIYPVLGNHEYDSAALKDGLPYFDAVFPALPDMSMSQGGVGETRHWYAVTYGSVQFVMLNSQVFWSGGDEIAEQDAWLEERLSDARFGVTIPVFHVPPYTSGLHGNDGKLIQTNWVWRFEAGAVPIILSGHDHNYERLIVDGITYIVTGGGSSVLYPIHELLPESQFFAREAHFVFLEIYPDHLNLSAISSDGSILDQATIIFHSQ
jgi:predicted phosphodiesterase